MSSLIPTTDEFNTYQIMAKKGSESKYFEKIGGEAGLLSLMLYARELGLPPLQCLFGGLNNIMGKIEISPRLMNSMIRKAGHKLEILECSDVLCRIRGSRGDTSESYTAEYKIDEARRAGLFKAGGAWEKYPSDMLFKSCLSRVAKRLFADVISTAYVEGEIPDEKETSEKFRGSPNQATLKEDRVEIVPADVSYPPLSEEQCAILDSYLNDFPESEKTLCDKYAVASVYDITQEKFAFIEAGFKKKKQAREDSSNAS